VIRVMKGDMGKQSDSRNRTKKGVSIGFSQSSSALFSTNLSAFRSANNFMYLAFSFVARFLNVREIFC
jgi:hypothetical protein